MLVYCNNVKCKYNDNNNQICTADNTYIVDRNCISSKKKPRDDNFRELMQEPFKANCRKGSGGYKANHTRGIK